ncbi:unnamed protein product [Phytophthora fragariaefolia]|uniref:Unnamed protein product n=1 Tax=Phytophthora fragariaefolia TaxID=1490495 RepID=A0A9W6X9Z8_9STRA|nr:unnamed protein product [Phytophthora fragariaefolia]
MRPSYADTVKLVEDNYFHWDFNMRMKLSRKGLLAHIFEPEFDAVSDRSTVQWKTNDLKALGVIAGDVSLTCQVYICGATTAAEVWRLLEKQFNRNTLKNRLSVTKKLHNFKMEPGTRFAVHVDRFKDLVLQMETIGEALDETRQLTIVSGFAKVGILTDTRVAEAMPTEDAPQIESCILEELENCNLVDGKVGSDDDIENESDSDDESNLQSGS